MAWKQEARESNLFRLFPLENKRTCAKNNLGKIFTTDPLLDRNHSPQNLKQLIPTLDPHVISRGGPHSELSLEIISADGLLGAPPLEIAPWQRLSGMMLSLISDMRLPLISNARPWQNSEEGLREAGGPGFEPHWTARTHITREKSYDRVTYDLRVCEGCWVGMVAQD